jgi:hypothetical protein
MFLRAGCFAILACLSLTAFADSPSDTITIPLKDIWALGMSGTTKVQVLEGDNPGINSLSERIAKQLRPSLPGEIPPKLRPGFAVNGTGHTALEKACAIFEDRTKPDGCFPSGSDVSVIFFSYQFAYYVRLADVERQGNTIRIHYQYVPHLTNNLSQHFAIIPMGKLPDGKYEVEIIQVPMEKKWLEGGVKPPSQEIVAKTICKPFSFSVGCKGQ